MEIRFGNVEIADIYVLEKKHQRYAQYVHIQEHILKLKQKIIKNNKKK